jgi:hypothetical protein
MDTDERELFRSSIRHATQQHTGADLDIALAELGWPDALAAHPGDAVAVLFEEQGEANATSSALDHLLATALGVDPAGSVAVVLPVLGGVDPPGSVAGEGLVVRGLGTAALGRRSSALVAVGDGRVVTVAAAELAPHPVAGLDPRLGLVEVAAEVAASTSPAVSVPWADAVALGQRALGYELVGASRAMLRLARDHALDRVQFGRPIAGFQAVRHRLAETLVTIEAADAALRAAGEDGTPFAAGVAKAIAGRSARTAARHCQQVLAGIGFTDEHDLHLYVRRVRMLDHLLGDSRSLTRGLGEQLLADRSLPAILPL